VTALQRTVFIPGLRTPPDARRDAVARIRRTVARQVPVSPPRLRRGVVLAAVDGGETTWPVLAIAQVIGGILGVPMRAVHARPAGTAMPRRLSAVDVPLRAVEGDVVASLLAACGEDDVVAVVLGARTGGYGERVLGRTASCLVTAVE